MRISKRTSYRFSAILMLAYIFAVLAGVTYSYANSGNLSVLLAGIQQPATSIAIGIAGVLAYGLWVLRRWALWLGLSYSVVQSGRLLEVIAAAPADVPRILPLAFLLIFFLTIATLSKVAFGRAEEKDG